MITAVVLAVSSPSPSKKNPTPTFEKHGLIGIDEYRALAKYQTNNQVRFAWWTAEEEGLLGAEVSIPMLSRPIIQRAKNVSEHPAYAIH